MVGRGMYCGAKPGVGGNIRVLFAFFDAVIRSLTTKDAGWFGVERRDVRAKDSRFSGRFCDNFVWRNFVL